MRFDASIALAVLLLSRSRAVILPRCEKFAERTRSQRRPPRVLPDVIARINSTRARQRHREKVSLFCIKCLLSDGSDGSERRGGGKGSLEQSSPERVAGSDRGITTSALLLNFNTSRIKAREIRISDRYAAK